MGKEGARAADTIDQATRVSGVAPKYSVGDAVTGTDEDGQVNRDLMFPLLIVSAAHDPETGEMIFTPADVEALTEKSAPVIERVATAAMRLAGMMPDSVDVGKVDSSTTPNDDARST